MLLLFSLLLFNKHTTALFRPPLSFMTIQARIGINLFAVGGGSKSNLYELMSGRESWSGVSPFTSPTTGRNLQLVSQKLGSRSIMLVIKVKFLRYRWHGKLRGAVIKRGCPLPRLGHFFFHLLSKTIFGMWDLRKMISVKTTTSLAIVTEARIVSINFNVRASEASERFRNSSFFSSMSKKI